MSLHNSIEYMDLNLRASFPLALRRCRMSNNLSQGKLAELLIKEGAKSAETFLKQKENWIKSISNWERGLSLPSLPTYFYLIGILGDDLSNDLVNNIPCFSTERVI